MESLGIRIGGAHALNTLVGKPNRVNHCNWNARPTRCRVAVKMSTTLAPKIRSNHSNVGLFGKREKEREGKPIPYEKLDEWMRDSVVEIVKRLPQSPLLVSVYDAKNGSEATLHAEKAAPEDWNGLKSKWENQGTALPEGLIFVEELRDETEREELEDEEEEKAWGVVVQGKGRTTGPACYLLKTSRVASGTGIGCTHFCLTKVKNFREEARSQLQNCWLLNAW